MMNNKKEIEKLNKAVFFSDKAKNNIFTVMRDEITAFKGELELHDKTVEAQLNSFKRT